MIKSDITLSIEPVGESEERRGFRWALRSPSEYELVSRDTFATRREAQKDGEINLKRAKERGRLR